MYRIRWVTHQLSSTIDYHVENVTNNTKSLYAHGATLNKNTVYRFRIFLPVCIYMLAPMTLGSSLIHLLLGTKNITEGLVLAISFSVVGIMFFKLNQSYYIKADGYIKKLSKVVFTMFFCGLLGAYAGESNKHDSFGAALLLLMPIMGISFWQLLSSKSAHHVKKVILK